MFPVFRFSGARIAHSCQSARLPFPLHLQMAQDQECMPSRQSRVGIAKVSRHPCNMLFNPHAAPDTVVKRPSKQASRSPLCQLCTIDNLAPNYRMNSIFRNPKSQVIKAFVIHIKSFLSSRSFVPVTSFMDWRETASSPCSSRCFSCTVTSSRLWKRYPPGRATNWAPFRA